jgi:hypothetical protein
MTCRTLWLLIALAVSGVVAALAAETQPQTTGHRIGWLRVGFPDGAPDTREEAFRQGLHDLGYVEDQHFVLEGRYAEGSVERLPDLAAELVRLQVEVLVAGGAPRIKRRFGTPWPPSRTRDGWGPCCCNSRIASTTRRRTGRTCAG